jgi:tetratricopeptide (TPR) repeat protein
MGYLQLLHRGTLPCLSDAVAINCLSQAVELLRNEAVAQKESSIRHVTVLIHMRRLANYLRQVWRYEDAQVVIGQANALYSAISLVISPEQQLLHLLACGRIDHAHAEGMLHADPRSPEASTLARSLFTRARNHFQRAFTICETPRLNQSLYIEEAVVARTATLLNHLGRTCMRLGHLDDAVRYLRRALDVHRLTGSDMQTSKQVAFVQVSLAKSLAAAVHQQHLQQQQQQQQQHKQPLSERLDEARELLTLAEHILNLPTHATTTLRICQAIRDERIWIDRWSPLSLRSSSLLQPPLLHHIST